MATPNWYNRRKGKQLVEEDVYRLDPTKVPEDSVTEILTGLYARGVATPGCGDSPGAVGAVRGRQGSDARRLSYLNALVTLLSKEETRTQLGYTTEELMVCVRVSLVEESVQVRASALRVLRYLIRSERDVAVFNSLRLPYLVVRSMDLMVRNEVERAQALRVVRRVVGAAAGGGGGADVAPALLRCLAAIARCGGATGDSADRLCRPAVATLGEIGVVAPALLVSCGGVAAVTRFLQELATPRMAEALCGVLLHALDAPASRRSARVDLRCLCAPYCDFDFRPGWLDKNREEREKRFTCSRLSLLCVLRSWPGVLHFCHPLSDSGLRALVHAGLLLRRLEVRKAILELLYELLGLPQPEWTDEISVALAAVDPSDFQDSWRLSEGFVAEEGRAVLPHLAAAGPDVAEIHLALLLYCFLQAGLLEGLAEVIVSSDTYISVRATVLLGQLLHLAHALLPAELCAATPPLPALLAHAAAGRPAALAALAALRRLHRLHDARPAGATLFLDHVLQCCAGAYPDRDPAAAATAAIAASVASAASSPGAAGSRIKLLGLFDRETDSLVRDSLVLQNKDGNTWNWEIIRTILKESGDAPPLQLSDGAHAAWTRRLLHYLRPSSNKYSHADMSGAWHGHEATRAGCQLVRLLLRDPAAEAQRMLEELFSDVNTQLEAILVARSAHDCLFSPQHMCTTMCQMYFLFVGQLCHTRTGLALFYRTGLYNSLLELATTTHHSCYVKLVVSSLDYSLDSYPRDILARTLTCDNDASRLYATRFLNVLLRASTTSAAAPAAPAAAPTAMVPWLLAVLVRQIKDESRAVVRCALSILDEACSVPSYMRRLVEMRETVRENCGLSREAPPACGGSGGGGRGPGTAGDRGYLLWLSLEVAAAGSAAQPQPEHDAFMAGQLQFWTDSYNLRYVRLVDAETHEALTLASEAGEEAYASRRGGGGGGGGRRARGGGGGVCPLPPHLHTALAHHAAGRRHLVAVLPQHCRCVRAGRCGTEQQTAQLKASLWAVGAAAAGGVAGGAGLQLVLAAAEAAGEESPLVGVVRLARHCDVYSVRAAALYVLGLVGSTRSGADHLSRLGWLCVRHTRHERFPIVQEESRSWRPTAATAAASDTDRSTGGSLHSEQATEDGGCARSASECSDTQARWRAVDALAAAAAAAGGGAERLRHTSESSTSGVSSCDSTLGRYVFPDRFQTLSPIPSSSSLSAMKSSASRRRAADVPRRTSVASYTAAEAASSPPSQQDLAGYAELKLFNSARRPHLSESAASAGTAELEELCGGGGGGGAGVGGGGRRARAFSSLRERSRAADERNTKLSLLKYDWKPMSCVGGGGGGGGGGARTARTPPPPPPPTSAPRARAHDPSEHYLGICLPADLLHIFPRLDVEEESTPAAPHAAAAAAAAAAASSRHGTFASGAAAEAAAAAASDGWPGGGGGGGGGTRGWHDARGCLACASRRPPPAAPHRAHPTTRQLRRAFFTDGVEQEAATGASLELPCSTACGTAPAADADSREDLSCEILKHATRMGNPLWHKQAKPALLSLKQRHPDAFQSVCLYSDVSALLAAGAYVATARRFLQELFLDARFDCFALEPPRVLRAHAHLSPFHD